MWHRRETRRQTENTNLDPNLKRIQTTRPELPIGRFLESESFGGNRVILGVIPLKLNQFYDAATAFHPSLVVLGCYLSRMLDGLSCLDCPKL